MNKKELIEYCESLKGDLNKFINGVDVNKIIAKIEQLDEPEAGNADEAPRYVRNILARLRELPKHDREVWLKAIMGEFERDFSSAKWREGYEQGKFEGMFVREKVVVPQFVADWYEEHKDNLEFNIFDYVYRFDQNAGFDFKDWFDDFNTKPIQTLVNMHQFGYEVKKERWYTVKMRTTKQPLFYNSLEKRLFFSLGELATQFTFKQLEEAGFGEVFNSPLFEVEEVTE